MSTPDQETLNQHANHRIAVEYYGDSNVTISCLTCNEVLIDQDLPDQALFEPINALRFSVIAAHHNHRLICTNDSSETVVMCSDCDEPLIVRETPPIART